MAQTRPTFTFSLHLAHALHNPFKHPLDTYADKNKIKVSNLQEFKNKNDKSVPKILKNTIIRVMFVALIYIAGLIFIPIIYKNWKMNNYKTKLIEQKSKAPKKIAHISDEKLSSTKRTADRKKARKMDGSQILEHAKKNKCALNLRKLNLLANHTQELFKQKTTLALKKEEADLLRNNIFNSIHVQRIRKKTNKKYCKCLNKLLLLKQISPVFGMATYIQPERTLPYLYTILSKGLPEKFKETSLDQSRHRVKQAYYDELKRKFQLGIREGAANASCASSSMAFLMNSEVPVDDGFYMHGLLGLHPTTEYVAIDEYKERLNQKLEPNKITIYDENLSDLPNVTHHLEEGTKKSSYERYNDILKEIERDSQGIMQVGQKFFAYKKNATGITIFDSHGIQEEVERGEGKAYTAVFNNLEDAALFLAGASPIVERRHIVFSKVTIPQEFTKVNKLITQLKALQQFE